MSQAPASPNPLRIAVLGVGGIGSAFAFQLARVGHHNVTVIARPGSKRLHQLQRDRAILNTQGESAPVAVADTLDETIPYDLVLVTLPAYQAEAVLPALRQSSATAIQFMCNTFDPERLRNAVGPHRCSLGMPFIQAFLDPDGKLNAKIGAGGQKSKMSHQPWVDLFLAAGLPAVLEPDMPLWLRCHVPLCIAFESVSVAAVRRGGGASWSQAFTIAQGLKEGFLVVQRLGYPLYPSGKARLNAAPTSVAAAMLWFMSRIRSFRELLATGENECRSLIEVVIAATARAEPAVSTARIEAMKP